MELQLNHAKRERISIMYSDFNRILREQEKHHLESAIAYHSKESVKEHLFQLARIRHELVDNGIQELKDSL
jgi:hypothetical protein